MVGIPNALFFPFDFGINILFKGFDLYFLFDKIKAFRYFNAELVHSCLSTPDVLFPLFDVTFLTASNLE
jgi:hypothetical protein